MGFFDKLAAKFKEGFAKTSSKLVHEIKRVITRSPRLTVESVEELEQILLGADLGTAMTTQIIAAVKKAYETQGSGGVDVLTVAKREIESALAGMKTELRKQPSGVTVVSVVGVNGTGKTTTSAKLAHLLQGQGEPCVLAACDTFRAAAVEQLKLWGTRLNVPVIAGARNATWLFVDTAGRLHTKHNLMQELQKVHRVMAKKLPGAPHEVLLVLDGSTGMNALQQAREFHKAVPLTGLIVTKLDGTSKGGMLVAIQRELGLPVKFIGVGEQPDDLQPFDAKQFAEALFSE